MGAGGLLSCRDGGDNVTTCWRQCRASILVIGRRLAWLLEGHRIDLHEKRGLYARSLGDARRSWFTRTD